MKIFKNHLWVYGILSAKSNEIAAKGLKRTFEENSCLCLFCGYANCEIPIGAEFDYLVDLQTKKYYEIKATLIDVTQQYAVPFDSIPDGWRAVARFMFSKEDLNFIKNEIPKIDDWSQSKSRYKLICSK